MRASREKVFSFSLLSYVYTLSCALFHLQGGSAQVIPHCSSSNGSVLACSWSRDAFQDPDTVVEISDVNFESFGHIEPSDFNSSCSTNASSRTASCTVWVYRGPGDCRKEISIEFLAVSQTQNFTEKLRFMDIEVNLAPPSDITATARNTREIEVRWKPPKDDDCPRYYICVQLQIASRLTNTWFTKLHEGCNVGKEILRGLTPGTLHDIRMRAKVNSEGNFGSWSENVTVQTLQEAPTGFVTHINRISKRTPGHPFERMVHLSWNGLDVSPGSSASLDYVIELEPSLGYNYTTNSTSFTIKGLDSFLEYHGSISAMNTAGKGPKKSFDIPDMTTQPQSPQVNYTVTPTSITVSVPTPVQPNGVIVRYEIRWTPLDQTDEWRNVTVPRSASSPFIQQVISPLKPSTSYTMEVWVFNKLGSSMSPKIIRTPQKAPSIKLSNFTVDLVPGEPDVVEIEWTHFQECYDRAFGYTVLYCALNGTLPSSNNSCYDGSEETIGINITCSSAPNSSPFRVGGLKPYTWYSFCLKPFNQAGYGPTSEPVLVQTLQAAPSPPVDMKVSIAASSPTFIVDVTWSQPLTPNGVIVHYNISYNMDTIRTNATRVLLKVFGDTDQVVGVSACTQPETEFACSTATIRRFRTPIMAPSAPLIKPLLPSGPRKVKVRWDPPQHPNGPIQDYVIKVWPTSTFENPTVSVVDADQREEEVRVVCGEDAQEEREFQIEILARTVNETDVELDGESVTEDIIMCRAPRHVSTVMLILPICLTFFIVPLLLAGLIYSRWFRRSQKFDIYPLDIENVRKRNKRFQHLPIPKPVKQESEVFDAIRTQTCCDRAEVEPHESPVVENIRATNKSVPRLTEYLSKDTISCPVIPNNVVSSRPDPCDDDDDDDDDDVDGDEKDNQRYSSGSSGYKSLNGYYSSHSLDRKFPMTKHESCDDIMYTAVLVTTGLPKNSRVMPKNSHVSRSWPYVTEQTISTSRSRYPKAKGVFDSWSNVRRCTARDVTCCISSVQLMDNHRHAQPRQSHDKHDEPVYCMF